MLGHDGESPLVMLLCLLECHKGKPRKYASVDLDNQLTLVLARIIDGCNDDDNRIKHGDNELCFWTF